MFFRVLKSGCRVEERLFEYMDRLLTCLGAVHDRGLADPVRLPLGTQLSGHQLRGDLRAGGVEIGLEGGASRRSSRRAAAAGRLRADWWRNSAATSTGNEPIRQVPKRSGLAFNACMTSPPAGNCWPRGPCRPLTCV